MRIIVLLMMFATIVHAQKKKVNIKYRKFEKFDLDELSVDADDSSPGDLSINPRVQNKFKNRLPYRDDFNPELRRSVESIR